MNIDKKEMGEDANYDIRYADIQDIVATLLQLLVNKEVIHMDEFIKILKMKDEVRRK